MFRMNDPISLRQLRLVVLDTSHLAGLASDWGSSDRSRRRAAQMFAPGLIEGGWLPLLSWHQVEELLQHKDDELVDLRLRYLRSWPLLASIRPSDPDSGPGSVLDILKAEVQAAYAYPSANLLQVRDHAREGLFHIGPGFEAIPDSFKNWRILQEPLAKRQKGSRRVAAIARWRATNIDNLRISDMLTKPFRKEEDANHALQHLRDQLADEIANRGDKRIADPGALADHFFADIAREGRALAPDRELPPVIQLLMIAGLELEDIDLSATFGQTTNLLIFRQRLRMVADAIGLPWQELKRVATHDRLPVTMTEECMRAHAQDQPERKGSDLNDTHLLCLASYADVTYVDKRTLESVRRARGKVNAFDKLIGEVRKAGGHGEISAALI
nr:hypothetical protein [Comamonas koreensis]